MFLGSWVVWSCTCVDERGTLPTVVGRLIVWLSVGGLIVFFFFSFGMGNIRLKYHLGSQGSGVGCDPAVTGDQYVRVINGLIRLGQSVATGTREREEVRSHRMRKLELHDKRIGL